MPANFLKRPLYKDFTLNINTRMDIAQKFYCFWPTLWAVRPGPPCYGLAFIVEDILPAEVCSPYFFSSSKGQNVLTICRLSLQCALLFAAKECGLCRLNRMP